MDETCMSLPLTQRNEHKLMQARLAKNRSDGLHHH
jgi:hypothetical protein